MDFAIISRYQTHLLIGLVLISSCAGLYLRVLPMDELSSGEVQKLLFMDTWYSMRQIEQISENFGQYAWFDAYNGFPYGKEIDWGPFYPIFCAVFCMALGSFRPDNMIIASWIPPLLSLAMIPVMFMLGTLLFNRKAGWISAILISFVAGEYMYRSFWGYIDHHLSEALFLTLGITIFAYLLMLLHKEQNKFGSATTFVCAALTGICYYCGIMTMPTLILFSAIVVIFLVLNAIIVQRYEPLLKLSLHIFVIYFVFSLLYGITGISRAGYSLNHYTVSHLIVASFIVIGTFVLSLIARINQGKSSLLYVIYLAVLGIFGYAFFQFLLPDVFNQIIQAFNSFFFFSYASSYINEMQMWTLQRAFASYNIGVILMAVGMVITLYQMKRSYSPVTLTALIWGFLLLISTILHLRYEYYLAPVVVLFSAIALSSLYTFLLPKKISGKTSSKQKDTPSNPLLPIRSLTIVGIIMLIFILLSAQVTVKVADEQLWLISMNDDWAESLTWLGENSPDPGVDYYSIYQKDTFEYPSEAYGVLSWWDYGHWITYLSKRIPITTPFQNNVPPVAQFLIATDEDSANEKADSVGARYIITDFAMVTSKFPALPLWAAGAEANGQFQQTYYQQAQGSNRYDPVLTLRPDYYETMAARLHFFDGSFEPGMGGNLFTTQPVNLGGQSIPVITKLDPVDMTQAQTLLSQGLNPGQDVVSVQYTKAIEDVPALGNYRLVYESQSTIAADDTHEIKDVKIFERVPGYIISGTGTIEIPLITNQGREFTWRQQSVNGTFTLPYSTIDNPYPVMSTGPYRIVETGKTLEVSEEEIWN